MTRREKRVRTIGPKEDRRLERAAVIIAKGTTEGQGRIDLVLIAGRAVELGQSSCCNRILRDERISRRKGKRLDLTPRGRQGILVSPRRAHGKGLPVIGVDRAERS